MKRLLLALLFSAGLVTCAHAQAPAMEVPDTHVYLGWYVPLQPVATTAAQKISRSAFLDYAHFANTSASTITITLMDLGTNCSGSPCSFWPAITVLPNQVFTVNLNGLNSQGGLTWVASAAGVNGWLRGRY